MSDSDLKAQIVERLKSREDERKHAVCLECFVDNNIMPLIREAARKAPTLR